MSDRKPSAPRPLAVEYSPEVLNEIRTHVTNGFERISRGGVEAGGVLFGAWEGRRIRVLAMRPVACSYIQGPVFALSSADHTEFERILSLYLTDTALAGMRPVGWFLSHSRDDLALRPSDTEVFERYFPEDWQVVLVTRPGRVGSLRATTIGRDDSAQIGTVLNEFTIKQVRNPQLTVPPESVAPPGELRAIRVKKVFPPPDSPPVSLERVPDRAIELPPPPALTRQASLAVAARTVAPSRRAVPWPGIAAFAAVLVLGALGVAVYLRLQAPEAVDLEAFPRDGVLWVKWNPASRSVMRATAGKIEVRDGDATSVRDLGRADLKRGLWPALCRQADCTARLSLFDGAAHINQEMVRFAGRPPALSRPPPEDSNQLELKRLQQDRTRLRDQLERERARADGLQEHVKVLQSIIQTRGER